MTVDALSQIKKPTKLWHMLDVMTCIDEIVLRVYMTCSDQSNTILSILQCN